MSLTSHYVNQKWKMGEKDSKLSIFPLPPIVQSLSNMLTEFLRDWGLENKVFIITLDNASANDNMIKIIKMSFIRSGTLRILYIFHVRCCAHVLNLIVQYGLVHIKDLIHNVRESAKCIRSSSSRKEDLLAHYGLCGKKEVMLDVPTRWSSTYTMLKAAKEFRPAFIHYAGTNSNYKWCPDEEE